MDLRLYDDDIDIKILKTIPNITIALGMFAADQNNSDFYYCSVNGNLALAQVQKIQTNLILTVKQLF